MLELGIVTIVSLRPEHSCAQSDDYFALNVLYDNPITYIEWLIDYD